MISDSDARYLLNPTMGEDVYESEDATATPPLQPVRPNYGPHKSPSPPFIHEHSESPKAKESPSGSVRKDPHRRTRGHDRIGLELIIRNIAPDRPDLLLPPEQLDSPCDTCAPVDRLLDRHSGKFRQNSLQEVVPDSRSLYEAFNRPTEEKPFQKQNGKAPVNVMNIDQLTHSNGCHPPVQEPASLYNRMSPRNRMRSQDVPFGVQLPRINSNPETRKDLPVRISGPQDDLALANRGFPSISRSHHASPTLPALQSPPQSIGSPDCSRSLPPIKALVEGSLEEPPRLPVLATLEPQYTPSFRRAATFSHISPASSKDLSSHSATPGASQNSYWPRLKSEGSQSQSPGDTSSHFTGSPATGYPTPIEPKKEELDDPSSFSKRIKPSPPQNPAGFKCDFPGCTADPFQTQYLLNSHANVHSENRPYYCPVKDCPRGEGRKGFKRKNEMIRHGLVHDSPGYVCPFCSDQQRRYPRPDNLQRHVRAQHPDRDKDDPLLRQVLSKRSEGVARGRRRRA